MKQYAASPIIQSLVEYRTGYFDTGWQDDFYDVVWNVDTAQGFGLDIWGRIVVIGRSIQVQYSDFFGFNTEASDQSWNPFDQESFYDGPEQTQTFVLADQAYRVLVLAKALTNISAADSKSLNSVLKQLFPARGAAWVNDLGSMAMRYTFNFALEPWERSVVLNGGALPRPAGVLLQVFEAPADTFGFSEAPDSQPFDQGTFLFDGALTNAS